VNELGTLLRDARDNLDADKLINGTAGSYEPVGILNIGVTGALSTSQRVLTNKTSTFAYADVWNLKGAVPPRFIDNASIVGRPTTFDVMYQFVGGGSSQPPLMPIRDGPVVELPQYASSAMASTTTNTGNKLLVVGDFKAGHVIGNRLDTTIELVPHLFGSSRRYPTGQRGLLAIWRAGAAVVNANALRYLEVKWFRGIGTRRVGSLVRTACQSPPPRSGRVGPR
jgi:HK97 family phage major capsid protein